MLALARMQRGHVPRECGHELAQRSNARRLGHMQIGLESKIAVAEAHHAQVLRQAAGSPALQDSQVDGREL